MGKHISYLHTFRPSATFDCPLRNTAPPILIYPLIITEQCEEISTVCDERVLIGLKIQYQFHLATLLNSDFYFDACWSLDTDLCTCPPQRAEYSTNRNYC